MVDSLVGSDALHNGVVGKGDNDESMVEEIESQVGVRNTLGIPYVLFLNTNFSIFIFLPASTGYNKLLLPAFHHVVNGLCQFYQICIAGQAELSNWQFRQQKIVYEVTDG